MFLLTDTVRCFHDMAPLKLDPRSVCDSLVSSVCAPICVFVSMIVSICVEVCVCVCAHTFDRLCLCIPVGLLVKGTYGGSRWKERKMDLIY